MRSILILAALLVLASMTPARAKDRYLLGSSAYAQSVTVGVRKLYPATIDEDQAMVAAAEGSGLWVPLPEGGRAYLKFVKTEVYANGDWSWIGEADTAIGKQPVVLTFGKDAVFGTIPMPSGRALHIVRHEGKAWVAQVDPALAAQSAALMASVVRRDDALAPPVARLHRGARTRLQSSEDTATLLSTASSQATASATATSSPVIDVMIAYTTGFATGLGSDSAAQTRLNYMVAYANQSYVNSKVNLRVRLVKTVKVSYPDNTLNDNALYDLSGFDNNGNSVTIPTSLSTLPTLRVQYGADLVALVRKYNHTANGSCGIAWLNGAGAVGIVQDDYPAGMAVVSDGTDGGYYCEDKTLTHELGHTMGLAHDIANASKDSSNNPIPGAYSYSYGYKTGVSGNTGFGTIMAYEDQGQESVQVFSNPSLLCQNVPCGVSNQADNARTLNQTASIVATFEATKVPLGTAARDVNSDGMSDLLFYNPSPSRLGYWPMDAATILSGPAPVAAGTGDQFAAYGDFNGDGDLDVVWLTASRNVVIWFGDGKNLKASASIVANLPAGWYIVAAGDVNADGKSDLLFVNKSTWRFAFWPMSGATILPGPSSIAINPGDHLVATGDLNGDGKLDLVWETSAGAIWVWFGDGAKMPASYKYIANVSNGWTPVGAADLNGDGKSDLLFVNTITSRFAYWPMNGAGILPGPSSISIPVGYKLIATGDFNGDGHADLAWMSSSREIIMWFGDGVTMPAATATVSTLLSGWVPMSPGDTF